MFDLPELKVCPVCHGHGNVYPYSVAEKNFIRVECVACKGYGELGREFRDNLESILLMIPE